MVSSEKETKMYIDMFQFPWFRCSREFDGLSKMMIGPAIGNVTMSYIVSSTISVLF